MLTVFRQQFRSCFVLCLTPRPRNKHVKELQKNGETLSGFEGSRMANICSFFCALKIMCHKFWGALLWRPMIIDSKLRSRIMDIVECTLLHNPQVCFHELYSTGPSSLATNSSQITERFELNLTQNVCIEPFQINQKHIAHSTIPNPRNYQKSLVMSSLDKDEMDKFNGIFATHVCL